MSPYCVWNPVEFDHWQIQFLSISCSFRYKFAKIYVGAPVSGLEILDPLLLISLFWGKTDQCTLTLYKCLGNNIVEAQGSIFLFTATWRTNFLGFLFYRVLEGYDNDTAVVADSDGVKEYLLPGGTGDEDPITESPLTPAEVTDAILYATNKITETQISEKSLQSRVAVLEAFHGIFGVYFLLCQCFDDIMIKIKSHRKRNEEEFLSISINESSSPIYQGSLVILQKKTPKKPQKTEPYVAEFSFNYFAMSLWPESQKLN